MPTQPFGGAGVAPQDIEALLKRLASAPVGGISPASTSMGDWATMDQGLGVIGQEPGPLLNSPTPPQRQLSPAEQVGFTPGSIYQPGSAAAMADADVASRGAAQSDWATTGGMSPSGRVYRTPTGEHPAIAATRAANQGMGGAGVVAPQGGGSYVAGGIQQAPSDRTGVASAVRTGDPFFDVNTDFDKLAAEKAVYDNNERAFSQANEARLGSIAGDRERADAQRAAKLAESGMTPDEIKLRMNPRLAYQPPSPEMQAATQRDAAERQGRSNLHAIAAKFRRNGMPPAMAYTMAMNTMNTTNQDGPNVGGTLPPIDPQRLAMMNPQGGMAAGQYGVGMGRNQVESDRSQLDWDAKNNQTEAVREKGLLESVLELIGLQQTGKKTDAEVEIMRKAGGVGGSAQLDDMAKILGMLDQGERGGLFDANPALRGQLQSMLPGNQGAQPTQAPQGELPDPRRVAASSPAAEQRYLSQFPPEEQSRQRALLRAQSYSGDGPVDFTATDYARQAYKQADPNLRTGPDGMWGRYGPDGESQVGWIGQMLGVEPRANLASKWIQDNLGYPKAAADRIAPLMFQ
jgi:hypothetical protein